MRMTDGGRLELEADREHLLALLSVAYSGSIPAGILFPIEAAANCLATLAIDGFVAIKTTGHSKFISHGTMDGIWMIQNYFDDWKG
ncbi:MAG: hypothetical protein ABSA13_01555 [Beijerinckiaceae bacterium]|jgi:hypothetical protein